MEEDLIDLTRTPGEIQTEEFRSRVAESFKDFWREIFKNCREEKGKLIFTNIYGKETILASSNTDVARKKYLCKCGCVLNLTKRGVHCEYCNYFNSFRKYYVEMRKNEN